LPLELREDVGFLFRRGDPETEHCSALNPVQRCTAIQVLWSAPKGKRGKKGQRDLPCGRLSALCSGLAAEGKPACYQY